MQFAQQRHVPTIVFPARFDLPAVITPRMFRPYRGNIPGGRLMSAARGKSEREKEVNFSHLARKRSHFSCCENGSRTWRVTPESIRASRVHCGASPQCSFGKFIPQSFRRGAEQCTRGRALPRWEAGRSQKAAEISMKRRALRDRNFTRFRRRRGRNDPFGFRGGVLPAKFFHIEQQEHTGHNQERTDPLQEPARVPQNLNRALTEILGIPRRLRHLEGLAALGSPPTAGKTEGMIHPALAGGAIALGGRDPQRALETSGRIAAFIARDLEIQQLERDWQWRRTPTVGNANWIWQRRNGDLPTCRNPLFISFTILFHSNADAVGQLICAIIFCGCEIHPFLRVRQTAIDQQLPIGPAGHEWFI